MSMRWQDKVVVITGATSGIGSALAMACAGKGAKVAALARRGMEFVNPDIWFKTCDVADLGQVASWVKACQAHFGHIDILINNASLLGVKTSVGVYDPALWRSVIEVNVNGPFYMSQAVLNTSML
ncbi:MAG: SDR family NAD(P)-dependent oxidoreductase, partial [Elusimicrobiota bacterium]